MMPDIDGLDLLDNLKQQNLLEGIAVYIHSGISDQSIVDRAKKLGASGFISKTSNKEQIVNILSGF